jgi:response regulator NasT
VHLDGIERVMERIVALDPDVIVIDLESPTRDVLEQMFQVSRAVPRPVAMFVDRSDTAMIQAAMDAGVSAYVVDGLRKERVKPILDMCISRFNVFSRMRDELAQAKSQLEERRTIDRAIADGCRDVEALGAATRAGTNCGSCLPELRRMLASPKPDAALSAAGA